MLKKLTALLRIVGKTAKTFQQHMAGAAMCLAFVLAFFLGSIALLLADHVVSHV